MDVRSLAIPTRSLPASSDKSANLLIPVLLSQGRFSGYMYHSVDTVSEVVKLTRRGKNPRRDVLGEEERANAIIMCANHADVFNDVLEMSGDGTTIVVTGSILPAQVSPRKWLEKRLRTVGVWIGPSPTNSKGMFELALHLIAHKRLDPTPLISGIVPFEDCQAAIDAHFSGEAIAVIMKP